MFIVAPSRDAYLNLVNDSSLSETARQLIRRLAVVATDDDKANPGSSNRKYVGGSGYIDFLLTGFSLQQSEQLQVSEVLSDAYAAYYFGQSAPRGQLSGIVFNTRQDNWYDTWYYLYQEWIRGTKLATRRQQVILKVDSRYYFGSIFNVSSQISSQFETMANFSMGFLVKRIAVQRQRSVVNISTDLNSVGISTQFTDIVPKNDDAIAIQEQQAEAVARGKDIGFSIARNISKNAAAVPVNASGDVDLNQRYEEGAAWVKAQLSKRIFGRGIPEKDMEAVNRDMGPVSSEEKPQASFEPLSSELPDG
jgi:hypothetical protein